MIVTYYYPWDYFYPVQCGAGSVAAAHLNYFKTRGYRPRILVNGSNRAAARRAFERHYSWVDDICVVNLPRYPAIQRLREIYSFGSALMWHRALCEIGFVRDFLSRTADLTFMNYVFATPLLDVTTNSAMRVLESIDIMSRQYPSSRRSAIAMQHSLRAEFDLYHCYDRVLMINHDETALAHARGAHHAVYVPRAVNVIGEEEMFESTDPHYDLLFVGSEHPPNAEGVVRFYETIFLPHLKPRGLRWAIAGSVCKHLPIRDPAVAILGIVGDLASLYRDCRIAVVPIFSGAGVSVKTLEALGRGKPVVTTAIGARGLHDSSDALIQLPFDVDPLRVAERILDLTGSHELRARYSRNGRAYIAEHFSYGEYARKMDALLARSGAIAECKVSGRNRAAADDGSTHSHAHEARGIRQRRSKVPLTAAAMSARRTG